MAEPATPTAPSEGGTPTTPARSFTQEDVEKMIGERLARERSKFADYDDLKDKASRLDELEQASKTETQKLSEQAASDAKRADTAELELKRFQAAAKAGLEIQYASRIQGSTPEEMEADAKQLAEAFKPAPPDPSVFDGGSRTPAPEGGMDAWIRSKRRN